MIEDATPGRVPIFVCRKSWLCCRLVNIFNLQNESFWIYFYQWNITFKNIINLVSFIKSIFFWRYSTASLSFWGIPPPPPPPWSAILDEGLMKGSLWQFELPHFFLYHISTGKRALQLLPSCMVLSIRDRWPT